MYIQMYVHVCIYARSSLFPCTSAKLEKDVKEALFAIAKQQGKVDPDVSVHVHTCIQCSIIYSGHTLTHVYIYMYM